MKPSDLLQLMPNVDFGISREEVEALPELPKFTEALRRRMEREVTLYGKPVLSIENVDWGGLYLILAAHERRTVEAEGQEAFAPAVLPRDSRTAVESVRGALKRTQKELRIALHQDGVARLLEGRQGSVADNLQIALDIVEAALKEDARRRSSDLRQADDDGIGRLSWLLAEWWAQRTKKQPSLSKANKRNGAPPAYVTFLQLCFTALSRPPSRVSADAMLTRRERHKADMDALDQALSSIKTRLEPMRDNSFFSASRRRSKG